MNGFQTSGDVGAHTESLQPRDNNSSSNEDRQAPVPAATTSGASEWATAAAASTLTTAGKCVSWRHVLASHWCRADMRGFVNLVLWACQIWMWDA